MERLFVLLYTLYIDLPCSFFNKQNCENHRIDQKYNCSYNWSYVIIWTWTAVRIITWTCQWKISHRHSVYTSTCCCSHWSRKYCNMNRLLAVKWFNFLSKHGLNVSCLFRINAICKHYEFVMTSLQDYLPENVVYWCLQNIISAPSDNFRYIIRSYVTPCSSSSSYTIGLLLIVL